VDFIGTLDGLYMDYVESMGSPWKPVGDCKVQNPVQVAFPHLRDLSISVAIASPSNETN
jgi:hypothetical protein